MSTSHPGFCFCFLFRLVLAGFTFSLLRYLGRLPVGYSIKYLRTLQNSNSGICRCPTAMGVTSTRLRATPSVLLAWLTRILSFPIRPSDHVSPNLEH